jgi:hypothetical protein
LTACLEKTILSEKMIEEELSRVEESATKSTYRLSVGFESCEDKGEKSAPKFIRSSTYHKEEATIKSTKAHYPSNPKPSFNPKREIRKETPKPREEVFVCIFCGRAGHLDEFCFRRKRIEMRHVEYARDSYRDEFIDFPPHSYSHVPPRFYSRASPHTFSRALPQFTHGPNHCSYGLSPRENRFEPRRFGYDPCPHRGDHFPCRSGFPIGGSFPHFEPRHLDDPHFPRRGSRPTRPSGEVQMTVKTSSGHMVKCWISKIYLTNPNTEPSTFSHPMLVMDGGLEDTWLMESDCSRYMTGNKKWFSSLTPLSHKEYVTFEDDKKGKVLGTDVIKVNDCFTLNDVTLMDRLRYNLLSVSQLCDADLSVLFHKSDSHVLDSSSKRVCGISHIGNVFQADFSSTQSSLRCLIS